MVGIGQTILCVLPGRLDTSGAVESDPRVVAAEQIAIRWTCEPGSIWWDKSAGLGLLLLQNADLSPGDLGRLNFRARSEALAVIGVASALVTASLATGTLTLTGMFALSTGETFTLIVTAAGAAEVLA